MNAESRERWISIVHAGLALLIPFTPRLWWLSLKGDWEHKVALASVMGAFITVGPIVPLVSVAVTAAWLVVWPRKLRPLNKERLPIGFALLCILLSIALAAEIIGLAPSIFFISIVG